MSGAPYERCKEQFRGREPRDFPCYAGYGAARARWPSRSSKPVRRGSPTLGRFDSCAAPLRKGLYIGHFCDLCVLLYGNRV
jgi:hypothetical protein